MNSTSVSGAMLKPNTTPGRMPLFPGKRRWKFGRAMHDDIRWVYGPQPAGAGFLRRSRTSGAQRLHRPMARRLLRSAALSATLQGPAPLLSARYHAASACWTATSRSPCALSTRLPTPTEAGMSPHRPISRQTQNRSERPRSHAGKHDPAAYPSVQRRGPKGDDHE